MFTDATMDDLLERLNDPALSFYTYLPAVSVGEALYHPPDDFRFWTNRANTPMKEIAGFMQQKGLSGLYEVVAEMVANAGRHGNKNSLHPAPNGDPLKSLSVKVFLANNGMLCRVRNEGEGFDYQRKTQELTEGTHSASILGGNGMRMLNASALTVSYEDAGRATNLLVKW